MANEVAAKITIDSTDPLFLHSSDHPGLVLVTGTFDGRNFSEWRRSAKIALNAKNKFQFVNGSLAKPADDDQRAQIWERCNDMVISWLLNGVSSEIRSSVIYAETAKEIWDELEARFGRTSGAQMFAIQKELNSISQGALTVSAYFTKLKSLWDELDSVRRFPACTCGSAKDIVKFGEEQKLMQFLMGLNENFTAARGSVLMIQPLPTVNIAYSMISQEETQQEMRNKSSLNPDLASSFNDDARKGEVQGQTKKNEVQGQGKKSNMFCTHCKKTNHMVEKCYFIHGFPNKNNNKNKRFAAQAEETESRVSVPELSPSQYAQLLDLLNVRDQKSRDAMSGTSQDFAGFAGCAYQETSAPWEMQ